MNIAVIIAGGVGARMNLDIPKQFISVNDKPVIIHTLSAFQKHPSVDAIEVVCLEGWHETLKAYAKQSGITKLQWVITGGASAQESIRNGVFNLEGKCEPDDIIIIHDGIRPLVDDAVLSDVIVKCQQYGNAVTSLPYNEQIFIADDDISTTKYIPHAKQSGAYRLRRHTNFRLLMRNITRHFEQGIGISGSSYANTMMADLGVRLYFAAGSDKNIKLTTKDDLEMFRAYLMRRKENYDA